MSKAADAFRTISEVADELGVPKHVLRFWEARFPQIRPMKRGGGRRYYRPEDMALLQGIRRLLHAEGYTIKGVQKILRERGVEEVKRLGGVVASAERPAGEAADQGGDGAAPPRRSRKGRVAAPPPALREVVAAAIAELEACRALLGAETAPAAAPHAPAQAPARRPRAAR